MIKYLIVLSVLFVGCSSVSVKPKGCPALGSRTSCMAAGAAERATLNDE